MTSRNVIVTGGAGYVGSHACKALAAAGYTPVTYDNMSIGNRWAVKWGPLELGDILDSNRVNEVYAKYKPIATMHFAAFALVGESMQEPSIYYRNNVNGTLNLLDACRLHGVSAFVFSSTCATYGEPDLLPINESTAQNPVNPYGASKLMVERILSDYQMAYNISFAALRYFNAAGADPDCEIGECRVVETHLIPLLLQAMDTQKSIKVFGEDYPTPDGTAVRDYIHAKDLADSHVRALEHLMGGSESIKVNLGTGVGYSVKQVIDTAESITGLKAIIENHPRRPGDPPELVADNTKQLNTFDLGREMYGLTDILQHAWAWHKKLSASKEISL